jgi:LmbE family N-acetylglucosaminyl deacetylase
MSPRFPGPRPIRLDTWPWPASWCACVLAPHPDDFDAAGVLLRRLDRAGLDIRLLVLSSSANGVEDGFCDLPTPEAKAALRENEQRASCRFFGLPESRLAFLRLEVEGPGGYLRDDEPNRRALAGTLVPIEPDIVLLPNGNDTNPDHRLVHAWWRRLSFEHGLGAAALLIRDPKTIGSRDDAYVPFGETEAAWKAELLRFHRSQHQRNLNTRGHGFDERILRINRESARRLGISEPYAESFEIEE